MIFDLEGNLIGEDYREYICEYPKPGWVDQDAEMLFTSSCAALKSAIAKSGIDPKDIAAMGLSTQRCTMVPVDENCRPLRKAISWQDNRSNAECDWIGETIGAERYFEITGLPIANVWAFPAILWIRNNEPEIYERAHKFLLTQEFILHRLGAEGYPEDWSNGSLQGLMEIDTFKWSQEIIDASGLNLDQLPDLVPSGKMVGRVSKEAAELTGMVEGTPLVTGGGDQQCAGIGAGVIAEGLCEVTLGTAGVSLCFMDEPRKDPTMRMPCSAHAYPGKWECEGLQNAAGASYRWFRDNLANIERLVGAHINKDPMNCSMGKWKKHR
jgi:xylulokinase